MLQPQLLISPQLKPLISSDITHLYQCVEWNEKQNKYSVFVGIWLFQDEWDQVDSQADQDPLSFTVCLTQDQPTELLPTIRTPMRQFDYQVSVSELEQHWSEINCLQNLCSQKYQKQKQKNQDLRSLYRNVLGSIPPLLALGKHLKKQSRGYNLWKSGLQSLEHFERKVHEQQLEQILQLEHIEHCSLQALCAEVLEQLICPQSWLKPSTEELWVDVDISLIRHALNLILSHFSQSSDSPSIQLLSKDEGVVLQLEVEELPESYKEDSRFQKSIDYVRNVAELHHGNVWMTSTVKQGISLHWFFPLVTARKILEVEIETQQHSGLIWLIDDEASVRLTVKRWLLHLGYEVQVFEEGSVLLDTLRTPNVVLPVLIICDADMPSMPGLEVLGQVFQLQPQIKRLLYTAREPNHWVIEAFNRGVIHRFIDKSQGPNALKACMQELLEVEQHNDKQIKALDELLSQNLLTLFLQPIFDSKGRKIEAAEALMRSNHPAFRGPLDILKATQIAQKELALQKVLTHHSRMIREQLPDHIKLFMNIDPIVFSKPQALDEVFSEIYPYAHLVVLELTERGQLCGDVWVESVKYLRDKGFEIALDDLGAGYNSLGAVAAVNPEIIKLDISLVSHIHQSSAKYEMVRLLSEYAQKHQIKTVAEGIEMAEEAEVCTDLNIKWLQGYHLARPMPFDKFQKSYIEKF